MWRVCVVGKSAAFSVRRTEKKKIGSQYIVVGRSKGATLNREDGPRVSH